MNTIRSKAMNEMNWLFCPEFDKIEKNIIIKQININMDLCKIPNVHQTPIIHWMTTNKDKWNEWPWGVLISRLWWALKENQCRKGLAKNTVNRLIDIFSMRFGDPINMDGDGFQIPFSFPTPKMVIRGKNIKFTLQAAFGLRSDCESAALSTGFTINEGWHWDYLVVGFLGEYSRKSTVSIESALESSNSIADSSTTVIIRERDWLFQTRPWWKLDSE